ncbi:olfactory receptor 6N1-like [Hippoglossus stenolepis]|uniref:olfactory receptor 6N1-like n=1 Tax=Hippoglossus stenolepis TaxID=195615 RepID=UPI001FAF9D02|nr:olfactory receptor 6N1-like [Hippoglossus stenolepis]
MENGTDSFYFKFTMFLNIGSYYYVAFVFSLLLYSFIVSANLVIILVISRTRSLHQPMYMFIALLSVNSLYGSTGFFPRFLMDLVSDSHLISRPACFTQIYVIYTYGCCEMTILGIMAYDRYVAVCQPLHYHRQMTSKTVFILIVIACFFPNLFETVIISLSTKLPLCGNAIQRVHCANWNVVKLSCVPTSVNNAVGMLLTISIVFLPLLFVLFTYLQIVVVCWNKSAEFKGKVLQSCLPHIVSFGIYSIVGFCDIALSRYDPDELNPFVAVILSLEFVVIPPVLNPLVYGLKLPEIRRHIIRMIPRYKRKSVRTTPAYFMTVISSTQTMGTH